jgi:trehalose synthase
MAIALADYKEVAPTGTVEFLQSLSRRVQGKRLLNINSTRYGGGVAEILQCLVPMLCELGVEARWEVIKGGEAFFNITKAFHNALQGQPQEITEEMLRDYLHGNEESGRELDLDADVVLVHDPQPAALVLHRSGNSKWVWRCHIDISRPQRKVWDFLRQHVVQYDGAVFSLPKFAQRLPIPQYLIYPSIDPLSEKNRELSQQEIGSVLESLGVPRDKPILLQVSRYDRFKDPIGVIEAYRMVKQRSECRLVLAGGAAADDPEEASILAAVKEAAGTAPDIHILVLPPTANLEINALQRAATIILQKSTKEGFGLTVSEGMWKGKPVIGGFAGGIIMQVVFGVTGYSVSSVEGAAFWIRYLLNNPGLIRSMGNNAREYVRRNFLITRHLADYLALMDTLL